jgi:hypothetical protein
MSLIYPLDILDAWPGWTTDFKLMSRDEFSRTAGGRTIPKNLGSPLWTLSATTTQLAPNLLDEWRARLDALENGVQTFKGWSRSRFFPIAYPEGSWPTGVAFNGLTATIFAVGLDNKSLRVDLLPHGFELRVGDMIQITRASDPVRYDLHRVMEATAADGDGVTGAFEVRPHLWPGVTVNDLVAVRRPWCPMAIAPGSISSPADPQSGYGTVSFQAIEAR